MAVDLRYQISRQLQAFIVKEHHWSCFSSLFLSVDETAQLWAKTDGGRKPGVIYEYENFIFPVNLLNIILDFLFLILSYFYLIFFFFWLRFFLSLLTVLLLPNGGTLWSCELLLLLCYCCPIIVISIVIIIISSLPYVWQLKRHVVHYEPFLCPITLT